MRDVASLPKGGGARRASASSSSVAARPAQSHSWRGSVAPRPTGSISSGLPGYALARAGGAPTDRGGDGGPSPAAACRPRCPLPVPAPSDRRRPTPRARRYVAPRHGSRLGQGRSGRRPPSPARSQPARYDAPRRRVSAHTHRTRTAHPRSRLVATLDGSEAATLRGSAKPPRPAPSPARSRSGLRDLVAARPRGGLRGP